MASMKDFKVAVVGGGMCGLACAVGLKLRGIDVVVFESTPNFQEVGAGVGLGPNALRALDGIGVLEAVLSRADEPEPSMRLFRFLSGEGSHELIHDYGDSSTVLPDDIGLAIYRPAFLDALVNLLDPGVTRFNKRCTSISTTATGSHIIYFADGSTHEADVVVGADGIRSVTRKAVIADTASGPLAFTNYVAYRGLVPNDTLREAGVQTDLALSPICWAAIDKHVITYPINMGKTINIVVYACDRDSPRRGEIPQPWVESVTQQELLDRYKGWGPDMTIMLQHLKNPSKWSIHAVDPLLQSYVRQKIVLVGDAAHAMEPHLGAGVGQGFEDVNLLCELLGHGSTNSSNLEHVLKVYSAIRAPRANMVHERSVMTGEIFEGYGETRYNKEQMKEHLTGLWEPVWHYDLAKELDAAVKLLE